MKLLALLAPGAMLAVLWALERLEVWMNHPPGRVRPHRAERFAYATSGRSSGPAQGSRHA